MFITEDEFEKIKRDGRLIVLNAALDSQCYFLTPNCNKCTHAVYVAGSKKCMYNLKTEMCYLSKSVFNFADAKSLGKPGYWQVNDMNLSIYYNKLFRGKFGRIIFTDKEKATEMVSEFNSLKHGKTAVEDFEDILSYDDYVKLEKQNRIAILPCKVGEKYYVAEPDCSECKYKNDGYRGCGYIPKQGESPYTCNYNNEMGKCYVFNQSNGNTFYIKPANFEIKEIYLMSESQYDLDRKSFHGVWTNRNKLAEVLKKVRNKSCV
jgi:hypothetical protein